VQSIIHWAARGAASPPPRGDQWTLDPPQPAGDDLEASARLQRVEGVADAGGDAVPMDVPPRPQMPDHP
jgi:hypothetical protein